MDQNYFKCRACTLEICWFCRVDLSNKIGHICVGDQKEKSELEFRDLIEARLLQKCPGLGCPIYVEDDAYNNLSKCQFCKIEFCFKCGAKKVIGKNICACGAAF